MNKHLFLIAAASLCFSAVTGAQSFDEEYAKVQQYKNLSPLLYNGAVNPVWTDNETFLFTNNEKSGEKVYEISLKKRSRTESTREALEEAMKASRMQRNGQGFFGMGRGPVFSSPDGKMLAYIKDNNLWVVEKPADYDPRNMQPSFDPETGTRKEAVLPAGGTQLTTDGTDTLRYEQIRWSPDSKKIAALRSEVMKERQILLRESRPADQVQPKYRWLDYAKPGDTLPQSTPVLFDVEGLRKIDFPTSQYSNQYDLRLGQWSPNSDYFTFEYNQRGHQLYQLVAVDAETGRNRVIAEEKTNTFIYYNDLYRYYFKDGRRILWISERDNWRHLYMIDAVEGTIKQLTSGDWNVREIFNVDEKKGTILFYASGINADKEEDPYNKHVISYNLTNGKWKDLTPENAFHNVSFNKDFTFFVDNMSRPDLPYSTVLRSTADGRVAMEIQSADISDINKLGFTMPEVFVAKGRDGVTDIWGTIYRPSNLDPEKKYPVVEYIYAGPHDSFVEKEFMATTPRFMRLVELGFIVVTIDGMGTDNRSKDFQDVAWRNIKDAGFPDRILWMQEAASNYRYMDLSNVGIYGYSAGGQNTLSALLFYPDFYKVGVALCGCHDNRMDKIWWNEQWMGWPIGPWYSESSNVDNAWRLEGKLFLINGEMDDNVDPASTLQVVAELVKNNKDFEQLYLPGHTHNLGSDYITRKIFKFFWDNCR